MKNNNIVYLKFSENWFKKNDIVININNTKLKILKTPHKTWWKKFFQFITFGVYQIPTEYKCKIIK